MKGTSQGRSGANRTGELSTYNQWTQTNQLTRAILIIAKAVIPGKAGIQKNTGFRSQARNDETGIRLNVVIYNKGLRPGLVNVNTICQAAWPDCYILFLTKIINL